MIFQVEIKITTIRKLFSLLLIFLFYLWISSESVADGTYSYHINNKSYSHYSLLTLAFAHGKLDLPAKPPKDLLELPDPYDKEVNAKFRVQGFHDLSLYKGKTYLYFGPTPVITLLLPYHWTIAIAKKINIPILKDLNLLLRDNTAILFFSYGALIWCTLFLNDLKKRFFTDLPHWTFIISILLIGICNLSPFLLRRPYVYELAISSALFFQTGSIYLLSKVLTDGKNKNLNLLLASLFLGLSVGSRPNLLFSSLILLAFTTINLLLYHKDLNKNEKFKTFLFTITPFIICLLLLGLYNYLRFNNILEFGFSYQLHSARIPHFYNNSFVFDYPLKTIERAYLYIFQNTEIRPKFPFIFLHSMGGESLSGFIPLIPFTFITLVGPYLFWQEQIKSQSPKHKTIIQFPTNEFMLVFIPFFLNLLFLLIYRSQTMRHSTDFYTYLIMLSCLIWFYYSVIFTKSSTNIKILNCFAAITALLSIINALALSITGTEVGGLKHHNPREFKAFETFFLPISEFISKVIKP